MFDAFSGATMPVWVRLRGEDTVSTGMSVSVNVCVGRERERVPSKKLFKLSPISISSSPDTNILFQPEILDLMTNPGQCGTPLTHQNKH